jgi:hypothetical protein
MVLHQSEVREVQRTAEGRTNHRGADRGGRSMNYHMTEIGENVMEQVAHIYGKKLDDEFTMEVFGVEGDVRAKFTGFGLFVKADDTNWKCNETMLCHLLTGQARIKTNETN